ncbi:capsule biosynthesis protein [Shewanella gaetbuli]|uniref:Capsular biosynthesis protein n=1 Tax=Shewanella gaetbuli TaxID=220752 RepID=A0A9X1ZQQ3_9GAMM|nr:capsular biosynthesis protein [Shewanella gaetbuli]MCL1142333.1 capsular biosynthesis protein [Shewanella gaetbuli]
MKNILFLQGPLGPFFKQLARYCSSEGNVTHKINFNGGDRFYSGADHVVDYKGDTKQWAGFLTQYLQQHNIHDVIVYGDCRFYHKVAARVAKKMSIKFWAFEEGYIRAGFVTLEQTGVNANSDLYGNVQLDGINVDEVESSYKPTPTFAKRAKYAMCYYFARAVFRPAFPFYQHHRPWTFYQEGVYWLKSFYEKWQAKFIDPPKYRTFVKQFEQNIFILPLQVEVDFQLIEHSNFKSMQQVLDVVMSSFAAHSSVEQGLLIKHHPQNRGFKNYRKFIHKRAVELGIETRVLYGHDFNLPDAYRHAKGVVTVNSTVGISALLHHLPTKVLGKALYNIDGLTYQGNLANFWNNNEQVNENLFANFKNIICTQTQLAGDFYKYSQVLIQGSLKKINGN